MLALFPFRWNCHKEVFFSEDRITQMFKAPSSTWPCNADFSTSHSEWLDPKASLILDSTLFLSMESNLQSRRTLWILWCRYLSSLKLYKCFFCCFHYSLALGIEISHHMGKIKKELLQCPLGKESPTSSGFSGYFRSCELRDRWFLGCGWRYSSWFSHLPTCNKP